jgi:hypothetical protein
MTFRVTAQTLVDITDTGVRRVRDSNTKEYHQQQNLNVLMQTIGLRTQIFDPIVTRHSEAPLDNRMADMFGNDSAVMWSLTFNVETEAIWNDGTDELALLKQDINGVAFTSDLDNTVEFPIDMFDATDNVNITFQVS